MATFNGTDPNGTWKLFVIDDATHAAPNTNIGKIYGGWGLDISTTGPPPQSPATPATQNAAPAPKKCKKKGKKAEAAKKKCKKK